MLAFAYKQLARLVWVQERWKANDTLPSEGIQVNGDSGNDAELFEVPGVYGCVVSNAMPELAAWADAHPSDKLFRWDPHPTPLPPHTSKSTVACASSPDAGTVHSPRTLIICLASAASTRPAARKQQRLSA